MMNSPVKMTVEQFMKFASPNGPCELVHGELVQCTYKSALQGSVLSQLLFHLGGYVHKEAMGVVFAPGTGFLFESERGPTVLSADLAYVSSKRDEYELRNTYVTTPPGLVIECIGLSISGSKAVERIQWWITNGVREAWVADPSNKTLTLHWPDGTSRRYLADQALDDSKALPGLTVELSKVFTR